MRSLRGKLDTGGQGRWVLAAGVVLAIAVTPVALAADGSVMRVGAGNSAQVKETRIVAQNVDTYATRQSNNKEGDGGSATYGCRSSIANEPCLFVWALRTARAFDFRSRGTEGGRIIVSGDANPRNNKPFTTNATGVATGLNADEVDGKSAADIVNDTRALTRTAAIGSDGTVDASRSRGVTSVVSSGTAIYDVKFSSDVSKCVYNATLNSVDPGEISAALATSTTDTVRVVTRDSRGDEEKHPFHLLVTC